MDLITIGPGNNLYTRFGHTALRVRAPGRPDTVYNFGISDFESGGLVLRFLRGRGVFHVGASPWENTIGYYSNVDREVAIQALHLDAAQTAELVRLLERAVRPENRSYYYHHFRDNCATRPRDLLDRVAGGRIRRLLEGRPAGPTLRHLVREGFTGLPGLLLLSELLLGREVDRPADRLLLTFLPRLLSVAVSDAGLAGPTVRLYARRGPPPLAGDPLAGATVLWIAACAAALLAACLVLLARRGSRLAGLPLLVLALPSGLLGLMAWGLALFSLVPELRNNELALAFWPTDLLLCWTAIRWMAAGRLSAGRALRVHAALRLSCAALALAGHAPGALFQQPLAPPVAALCLCAGSFLAFRTVRGEGRKISGVQPRPDPQELV